MAKVKKTLVMDSEVVEVLDRYADLIGISRSAVANNLLLQATPLLQETISELEKVMTQKGTPFDQKAWDQFQRRMYMKMSRHLSEGEA